MGEGETFDTICDSCVNYVKPRYGNALIVCDGYAVEPSTKDPTHQCMTAGGIGITICFTADMCLTSSKETFLSNTKNKQAFIFIFSDKSDQIDTDLLVLLIHYYNAGNQLWFKAEPTKKSKSPPRT